MSKIIRVEIQDGLLLPSGFLAPAGYTCVLYLRVPEEWLNGDELLEPHKERVFEQLYGKSWRQGNEDGSRYHVLSMTSALVNSQDEADRLWLQDDPGDRRHQYWYYHVASDGSFQSRKQADFNQ